MTRWRRFLCNVLGWHKVTSKMSFGFNQLGIGAAAHCDRCGRRVLQDSNGDWFTP